MKKIRGFSALLLIGALLLALTGCRTGTPAPTAPASPTPTAEASPSPAPDLDLVVCLGGEPRTMDPTAASAADETTMLAHLFEGLMKWAPGDGELADGVRAAQLAPGMAERYDKTTGEDGSVTYTFHLRSAQWSDGKPVTAQDFVYSWQRLVTPANGADYAYLLEPVVNARAILDGQAQSANLGVRAVDESTFAVTLAQDVPWFLQLCALPATAPLRQDAVEAGGTQWTYDLETYLTNGPYRLRTWSHSDRLVVEKSETYYDKAAAGPDTITFYLQTDADAVLDAFEAGSLDFVRGQERTEGEAGRLPFLGSYYLIFQTQQAPFDDPLVRQAFSLAIDRTALAGSQTPAGALVPTGTWDVDGEDFRARGGNYLDPAQAAYEANCDKARDLLRQAGYPEGQGLGEVIYLYPGSPTHRAVAQSLQTMWREALGVNVTLKEEEWGAFLGSCHAGAFSIARGRWVADYNDPLSFLELWRAGADGNDGGYASETFDQLLDRAAAATDPAQRMGFLHQAEDQLLETDCALAPLYFETGVYLRAEGLDGLCANPLGLYLFGGCSKV